MKGHTRMWNLQLPSFPLCIRIPLLVHHHTKLFVAELVVLQNVFFICLLFAPCGYQLVFLFDHHSIHSWWKPIHLNQSCAPTNHLVVVVFSESRVNLRFAQTPTSSLRKANWLILTLLPRWNDEYNQSVLYIEAYLRGDH